MSSQPPDDGLAIEIATALLDGFDRHYRLFRATSAAAQARFEAADWPGQQRALRERIEFYDLRVHEVAERLRSGHQAATLPMATWQQVKRHYIGLLAGHQQPELAETFFNSVTTRILHRDDVHDDVLFVRPAVSTELIEHRDPAARPLLRAWHPTRETLRAALAELVGQVGLRGAWEDLARDVDQLHQAMQAALGDHGPGAELQLQALTSLFFRNKGAYIVGRIGHGGRDLPFALPILHGRGGYVIDAALLGEDELLTLFSFAHAYFMVEMDVPSACVQFLRGLMPRKPPSELYSALGLHKQGKTMFLRDLQHHLRHSSDRFRISPGVEGMVMLVFDLPSYPVVFKLIKDRYPAHKRTTRELIQAKYRLVKQHDRVGRMADTLEFSNVALPRARFEPALLAELLASVPSQVERVERDGDEGSADLVLRHVYIERRMTPLNLYLQQADAARLEQVVIDYGRAIKDLVAANIFPGDMVWKNFGVTGTNKVVFYDYDEVEYLGDCRFRRLSEPLDEVQPGQAWCSTGPRDVFPETFGPFLLGHPGVRAVFMRHHADLLDPAFWQGHQQRIAAGHVHDVFPYEQHQRFIHQRRRAASAAASLATALAQASPATAS